MKISIAALLALPAAGAAFTPAGQAVFRQSSAVRPSTTLASAAPIVTGPGGKAASSKEEDIMLCLQIIMDHDDRSTTVTAEQHFTQQKEIASMQAEQVPVEPIDISIPYDAAAKLAYEASPKTLPYDVFKEQYEFEAAGLVKSKQSLAVPYDAAAMLEYVKSDRKLSWADFKAKYEEEAVAMIKSKQPEKPAAPPAAPKPAAVQTPAVVDISIPYDAAAKLAYEASPKTLPYPVFKEQYEFEAAGLVKSKQSLAVPYDAAAMQEYVKSDRKMSWADFKAKYEAEAVALVTSKQPKKEAPPAAAAAPKAAAPAAATVDISIPYDAAAKLAYEVSPKTLPYPVFKEQYEFEAAGLVKSKQSLAVPYDATAMNAYVKSDRKMSWADFKAKFLADAVAEVIAKQKK